MSRFLVKQQDSGDCGAACLSSIGRYFGVHIPILRLRQMAGTDKQGTNVLGLIEAAGKMGLQAKGVKAKAGSLGQIPLPAIAHVVLEKNNIHHYMVLYRVRKERCVLMDPATGRMEKYTLDEFSKIWSGVLILFSKKEDFRLMSHDHRPYRRFLKLVRPHLGAYLKALFGALLYTLLGLGISIYVQKVTDFVIGSGNTNLLGFLTLAVVVVVVLQYFFGCLKSISVLRTGQLIDTHLILGYYRHLLVLPQRFFDTMQVGEIVSRINDAVKIRILVNDIAIEFLVNILIVFSTFILMFSYYWKLSVILLFIIPCYILIYFLLNQFNKTVERRLMERSAKLESHLIESINHVRTIKEYGMEEFNSKKTEKRFKALLSESYRSGLNTIFSNTSTQFLASFFTILLVWTGAGYVLTGQITTGELFSFYALLGYATGPVISLIGMNKSIQNALIAADRLFDIMDLERERNTHKSVVQRIQLGHIRFENVDFRYGSRAQVFNNLNLTIRKNEITAIVGASGSGKTSLISLLQKLYPWQNGRIIIGKHNLKDVDSYSLRKIIGVIPQQLNLFSGSILHNIALGDDRPDVAKVMELMDQLGMTEFLEGLPEGLATVIGENGAMLSGGQKQRIAIARALYRDPEILLLDEATSSLDNESEELVRKLIKKQKDDGKTIIIATHKLKNISDADKICVLEKGSIVATGNHKYLMSRKKFYHQMWKKETVS